jgi:hypothetical protein
VKCGKEFQTRSKNGKKRGLKAIGVKGDSRLFKGGFLFSGFLQEIHHVERGKQRAEMGVTAEMRRRGVWTRLT